MFVIARRYLELCTQRSFAWKVWKEFKIPETSEKGKVKTAIVADILYPFQCWPSLYPASQTLIGSFHSRRPTNDARLFWTNKSSQTENSKSSCVKTGRSRFWTIYLIKEDQINGQKSFVICSSSTVSVKVCGHSVFFCFLDNKKEGRGRNFKSQ